MGLPVRPFLYSLDQIAVLLDIEEQNLKTKHMYFVGRSTGIKYHYHLVARNIAPPAERPDWRVAELELIRWLKMKGFKLYEVRYLV